MGILGRELRVSAKDRVFDPLSEPKQVIVAVFGGEGDVGFRAVIELPPKIAFVSRFSMLEIRRGQV